MTHACWRSRFLQVDPIEGGCSNDYAYVFGDPVNATDLTGTATDCGKLWERIWNAVFRNKRKLGGGGTHGLMFRHQEMHIDGKAGGRAKFDTHRKAYEEQRKGLNRNLNTYDRDCGGRGGPPTSHAIRDRMTIDRWAGTRAPPWGEVTRGPVRFQPPQIDLHPITT
jgi:hypothetical protein